MPEDPTAVRHAAVAAPYAHVTAPLRRLCDRATIEVCLALFSDRPVPDEVLAQLADLPAAMGAAKARESGAARAAVDLVETLVLRSRVGEVLSASVVSADDERSTVVIPSVAIEASVGVGNLPLGELVSLRVEGVDPMARKVHLTPV